MLPNDDEVCKMARIWILLCHLAIILLADEAVKFRKQAVQTGCDVQPHGGVAGRGWTTAGVGDDKNCGAIKEIRIFMANRKN